MSMGSLDPTPDTNLSLNPKPNYIELSINQ